MTINKTITISNKTFNELTHLYYMYVFPTYFTKGCYQHIISVVNATDNFPLDSHHVLVQLCLQLCRKIC